MISTPARAWETGHPAFAPSANSANCSAVRPGTTACTVRWLPVMPVRSRLGAVNAHNAGLLGYLEAVEAR